MRAFLIGCGGVLSVVLGGCLSAHDCYEVEIRPEGEAFHRKLTCWHVGGPNNKVISRLDHAQLVQIRKLYPKRESPIGLPKQTFSGRFRGSTPADVGGAGSYTYLTSALGSASCYVERFRGDDDLASQLAKRRESADRFVDLLLDWLCAELGRDPNFPRLKQFLEADLRQDLKNLAAYTWAAAATDDAYYEWLVRAAQYFSERGYFSPEQVPLLVRAVSDDDEKPVLRHIQRLLARKMGIPDDRPVPASLAFLDDRSRLDASFDKYAKSSGLLRKRLDASKSQMEGPPRVEVGEAPHLHDASKSQMEGPPTQEKMTAQQMEGVLTSDFTDLIGFEFSFGSDTIGLKLFCDVKPYSSNGKWDEKGAVAWSKTLGPKTSPPVVCFALWSTPDRSFQEKHFGRVLLTGTPLAEYVTWYRSLGRDEAAQWDQFLVRLQPGPGLKAAVQSFRFRRDLKPDPKKPKEQPASLADPPRQLILAALEGKNGG